MPCTLVFREEETLFLCFVNFSWDSRKSLPQHHTSAGGKEKYFKKRKKRERKTSLKNTNSTKRMQTGTE